MSAALFEVIGHVEVILRNAIHSTMSAWGSSEGFGSNWYDNSHGLLGASSMVDISRATERLRRSGKSASPDRLVSELNFGFWRFLLTSKYRTTIWPILARNMFSRSPSGSPERFFASVGRIHDLRNRIAHHESLIGRSLELDLHDLYRVLSLVCPESTRWVAEHSRVEELLIAKP